MRKCLLLFFVIFLTGCQISPKDIVALINASVPVAIDAALVRSAKSSPNVANAAARNISDICKTDLIPLVQNGNLSAGTLFIQIQQRLEASIGDGWGTTVASILGTVFANVNIKSPTMNADEQSYVLAGLTSLAAGCDLFLSGKIAMLDGSTLDRNELVACLADFEKESRTNDATHRAEIVPYPTFSIPQARCRNGQCNQNVWRESQTRTLEWDSDGDGHGQGCYR